MLIAFELKFALFDPWLFFIFKLITYVDENCIDVIRVTVALKRRQIGPKIISWKILKVKIISKK